MHRLRSGFTTRASCLLAAGLTAVVCGLVLGEVNLLRAGVLAAVVPFVASVAVQRARLRIGSRRSVAPGRVSAGEAVTVSLVVSNASALRTTTLMVEDAVPDVVRGTARFVLDPIGSRDTRTITYRIPRLTRGRYRVGPLRVRLTDPFGLIDLTRSFTATDDFLVTPAVDPLAAVPLPRADDRGGTGASHSIGSLGADDASTREYRVGDDLRKIHWRSTARTGQMMVRQEERPWQGQATVLLDLRAGAHAETPDAPPGTDPRLTSSLEWAVSATASIGAHAMHGSQRFTLACDPTTRTARQFDHPDPLLAHLAVARAHRAAGLDAVLSQLRAGDGVTSLVAVLGRLGAADLARLSGSTPRGLDRAPAAFLLDVDSWLRPVDDVDPVEPSAAGASRGDLRRAAAVLQAAGWRVTIVHRGDSVTDAWQRLLGRGGSGAALSHVLAGTGSAAGDLR